MKTFAYAIALLASAAVHAETVIDLPIPSVAQDGGTPWVVPQETSTVVTGFSADGNYVLGLSQGSYRAGGGRGGIIRTYYVCGNAVWDLGGNLVSVTPFKCSAPLNLPGYAAIVYEGPAGYSADTAAVQASWKYQPQLITP